MPASPRIYPWEQPAACLLVCGRLGRWTPRQARLVHVPCLPRGLAPGKPAPLQLPGAAHRHPPRPIAAANHLTATGRGRPLRMHYSRDVTHESIALQRVDAAAHNRAAPPSSAGHVMLQVLARPAAALSCARSHSGHAAGGRPHKSGPGRAPPLHRSAVASGHRAVTTGHSTPDKANLAQDPSSDAASGAHHKEAVQI